MSRNKQLITKEIESILFAMDIDELDFDPEDIARAMIEQCPDTIREYLNDNNLRLITLLVQNRLKRVSGESYHDAGDIPMQQVFDFAVPTYLSFRNGNGKCRYIKTLSAHAEHFKNAAEELFKQSSWDAAKGTNYQKIANFLSANPDLSLSDALKLLPQS